MAPVAAPGLPYEERSPVLTLPQPFEDLGHTADLGVRVRGATAAETLERLCLALGALLAGGGPVRVDAEELLEVEGGPGLAGTAAALLRELLYRFATARRIPAEVEVLQLDEAGTEARVGTGRWDPELHAEGQDVKAITWHLLRLEREGREWVGQVVLDV
jgi:SHS2 domain-containing protein